MLLQVSEKPVIDYIPRRHRVLITITKPGDKTLKIDLKIYVDDEVRELWPAVKDLDSDLCLSYDLPDISLESESRSLTEELSRQFSYDTQDPTNSPWYRDAIPAEQCESFLTAIAIKGYDLYRRLFLDIPGRIRGIAVDQQPLIRAFFPAFLQRSQIVTIDSPVPLFPWAFLCDTSPRSDKFDAKNALWGFKHQIQEVIEGVTQKIRMPSPATITAAVCPSVERDRAGVGFHETIDHPFKALNLPVRWIQRIEELRNTLRGLEDNCFYFYGHHKLGNPDLPLENALLFDGQELSVAELQELRAPLVQSDPVLVYLNGCFTTPLTELTRHSVVGCFVASERSGNKVCCVATTHKVPLVFGASFAKLFWSQFLIGKTVGDSLLYARQEMLNQKNNPLGLLYVLFGRSGLRLI